MSAAWRRYDVTPDGRKLLIVTTPQGATSTDAAAPQIDVVLNWTEELKRLVPPR